MALRGDMVLGEMVRQWVRRRIPGEPAVAERAAAMAQDAYADGASVNEACEEAESYVGSWLRHPAHRRLYDPATTRLAS